MGWKASLFLVLPLFLAGRGAAQARTSAAATGTTAEAPCAAGSRRVQVPERKLLHAHFSEPWTRAASQQESSLLAVHASFALQLQLGEFGRPTVSLGWDHPPYNAT
jgi:hypothetical protein